MARVQRVQDKVVRLENKIKAVTATPSLYSPQRLQTLTSNLGQAQKAFKDAKDDAPFKRQMRLEQQSIADTLQNTVDFKTQYQTLLEAQQAQVTATTAATAQQTSIYDRLLAEQQRQQQLQQVKAQESEQRLALEQQQMLQEQNRMNVLTQSRVNRSTAYRSIYSA